MPSAKEDLLSSNRAVLDGYRRGDRAASLQVFRFYVDDVYRWVRQGVWVTSDGQRTVVGAILDAVELEEVVQDVFLRVFRPGAREGYDGIRPFRGYLLSITRNILIDAARKRNVQAKGNAKIRWSPEPEPPTPEELADQQALRQTLQALKKEASKEEQVVWTLRFEEGKSLRKVGEEMGVSMHRVRRVEASLRNRVLQMLRKTQRVSADLLSRSLRDSLQKEDLGPSDTQQTHTQPQDTYEEA